MPKQPWEPEDLEERLATALGRAIASRRGELGLKRNDLRDRSGLSYPYIAELENGTKRASSKALAAIAAALELSVSELMARAESISAYGSAYGTAAPAAPAAPPAPAALPPASMTHGRSVQPEVASAMRRARSWFAPAETSANQALDAGAHTGAHAGAPAGADAERPGAPLTEERVREIVRDELKAAGLLGKARRRRGET